MRRIITLVCLTGLLPALPPAGASIVGTWRTNLYYGDLVNPATGAIVTSAYAGTWYKFSANGKYTSYLIASGQLVAGVIVTAGTFSYSTSPKDREFLPVSQQPLAAKDVQEQGRPKRDHDGRSMEKRRQAGSGRE